MLKDAKKKSLIFLLITFVIFFFILKDNFKDIIFTLSKSNLLLILLCLLFTIIYYSLRALSTYIISLKYKNKIKYKTYLKQTIITQFFNGITPFATGGQPMQIYMLTKENMPVSTATSTVLMDFMAYQVAIIIYCIITLLLDIKLNIFYGNHLARNLVFVGFVINLFVCFFASVICFSTKATSFITRYVSKLLIKFHKEELSNKLSHKVTLFHEATSSFIKDRKLFIKCIILNILGLTSFFVIPFFVAYALIGNFNISILISIVSSSYVFLVGAFVPIPGGSGGIEYGFMQFFGTYFLKVDLLALLLLWRFVTYYFGIILGGILFSFYKNGDD